MELTTKDVLKDVQLQLRSSCMSDVKAATGISTSTLHRWKNFEVKKPHLATFQTLITYFGYTTVYRHNGNKVLTCLSKPE